MALLKKTPADDFVRSVRLSNDRGWKSRVRFGVLLHNRSLVALKWSSRLVVEVCFFESHRMHTRSSSLIVFA